MLMRRALLAALLVGMVTFSAPGQEKAPEGVPDKITLKWKFEEGKPFYQKMTTKTDQAMKVMANEVKQVQNQTFYFVWTPVKQDGDNWIIKQKIEGVRMDIDVGGGGGKITFDSTQSNPSPNPLSDFFKTLVDAEFELTLNKEMKVTNITGRNEFVKKLVAANQQMKPLLDQILSEKSLMEMAEPTFQAVPGKEVEKGKPWTKETSLDMGPIGKYENKYTFTYEGLDAKDKKLARIKVGTDLTYKEPAEAVAGGGVGGGGLPFRIKGANLKSTGGTGTILFNPDKGRIENSEMNIELKGDLNIEVGGQATKVDLSQMQKTTVETSDTSQLPKKEAATPTTSTTPSK